MNALIIGIMLEGIGIALSLSVSGGLDDTRSAIAYVGGMLFGAGFIIVARSEL